MCIVRCRWPRANVFYAVFRRNYSGKNTLGGPPPRTGLFFSFIFITRPSARPTVHPTGTLNREKTAFEKQNRNNCYARRVVHTAVYDVVHSSGVPAKKQYAHGSHLSFTRHSMRGQWAFVEAFVRARPAFVFLWMAYCTHVLSRKTRQEAQEKKWTIPNQT